MLAICAQSLQLNGMKKVVIVGPECTGKSTLSEALARHYNTVWVPEYARGYLENLVMGYQQTDLLSIARGQLRLEEMWSADANRLLLCDTDLLVIKIWSQFKYGNCDPFILNALNNSTRDLYLLTYVDIPWEEDPQREHPDKREELYQIYLKELKLGGTPFVEIKGSLAERERRAVAAIDQLLIPE